MLFTKSSNQGFRAKSNQKWIDFARNPTKIPKLFFIKHPKIPKLFADAEVGEDFGEDVVGGDFAGDFAEPV